MELILTRGYDSGESTIGILDAGDSFFVTIEDTQRKVKIKNETAIPKGRYKVDFRKVKSGKTLAYRKKFDWFNWHLWLQDVPNFQYVYIHIGNFAKDTSGCVLIANKLDANAKNFIGESSLAFRKFYLMISKKLEGGEDVWITIK